MGNQPPQARHRYRPKLDRPEGQPRPLPRYRVRHQADADGDVKRHPEAVYPHEIVNIRRKADLKGALERFSHPFPMMPGSPSIKHKSGMRYLVEWIYPALRWYCRVYGETIPQWLEAGKGWQDRLPPGGKIQVFGKKPIEPREWIEDQRANGARE